MVSDIYNGGTLEDMIKTRFNEGIPIREHEAANIIKQLLSATRFIHKNHIVHGNISLDNILLTKSNDFDDIKLKNFLYSCHWKHYLYKESQDENKITMRINDLKVSYLWNAPEVLMCQ